MKTGREWANENRGRDMTLVRIFHVCMLQCVYAMIMINKGIACSVSPSNAVCRTPATISTAHRSKMHSPVERMYMCTPRRLLAFL